MRTFDYTSQYRRDERLMRKQGKDMAKLDVILELLINGSKLPKELRDHALSGNMANSRELHIGSDWLLVYRLYENNSKITFERTGSHSELFR
ncbi:MAG: type II toxin-antitoxin system YafQ family toxin [Oscillospiraceae bacterium]|nr:type II toxin-antitoxin system YafQ family toxin [Oscillospiraceae bacterium]